jgi:hypothetical protein
MKFHYSSCDLSRQIQNYRFFLGVVGLLPVVSHRCSLERDPRVKLVGRVLQAVLLRMIRLYYGS